MSYFTGVFLCSSTILCVIFLLLSGDIKFFNDLEWDTSILILFSAFNFMLFGEADILGI